MCHCGHNIGGVVDLPRVKAAVEKLPGVVSVMENQYTCSELGQQEIAKGIKENKLERVVVAACSPRMHERVFRKVLESSGLNPYFLEVVNLREHCSWVHSDREKATEKAIGLVKAGVAKALLLEPLETEKRKVTKTALVIGGGVAGIFTSLYLAENGVKTYLVEKEPSIGGHMALLDKTFPTLDCSLCILSPKMVEVKTNPNITLYANSEVVDVQGYAGNYKVKVKRKPRYVDESKCIACGICAEKCPTRVMDEFNQGLSERKAIYIPLPQAIPNSYLIDPEKCLYLTKGACQLCVKSCDRGAIDFSQKEEEVEIDVGAIVVATGFTLFDASTKTQYGYKRYPNIISNLDFERLINASGPTRGKLKKPNSQETPESVAFIQCVGSRDEDTKEYCSRVCCMITVKQAIMIKEKYPDTEVYIYYTDMRTPGKGFEEFYKKARENGVVFIRGKPGEVKELEDKRLELVAEDMDSGELVRNHVDLVVLASGLHPPEGLKQLSTLMHLPMSGDGFLMEAHPKLRPAETNIEGVYLAGCVQFPKDIPDTVAQAGNAASSVMNLLSKDYIESEGITARVNEKICVGCGMCVEVCPYNAIKPDEEKGVAVVESVLCKGCGLCNAACFSKAIQQSHYRDHQIIKQIRGLLE